MKPRRLSRLSEHTSLNVNLIVTFLREVARVLGVDPIKHPRERYAFPNMLNSGKPADGAFDT